MRHTPQGVSRRVNAFIRDQRGATAVEYGILVALIALVIFGAVTVLGDTLLESYDCAATALGGLPDTDADCLQ